MTQSIASIARQPSVHVLANGAPLSGVLSLQWSDPRVYNVGSFTIHKSFTPGDVNAPAWWAETSNKQIDIEIRLALAETGYVSMFTGQVDSHALDPLRQIIALRGRDMAAQFLDTRITETYQNLTSSEIATTLAQAHGLTAQVTPTTTLVGRYYNADYDTLAAGGFSRAVNEWDLLCLLGQREGIVPYVLGSTLYFQIAPTPPPSYALWVGQNSDGVMMSNCKTLVCERALTMARDVNVTVKSWHSGQKTIIVGSALTKTLTAADGSVPSTNYSFEIPNLTKGQADAAAQRLAQDIAQHERVITANLPGIATLTPQTVFTLTGTGTDYDGIDYFPSQVTHSVTPRGGFETSISAKNCSPLSLYDGASGALIK
jgi:phage protein D